MTKLPDCLVDSYEIEGYVNREVSQTEIVRMLKQHGYTDAETVNEALDEVTDLFTLLAFLGY